MTKKPNEEAKIGKYLRETCAPGFETITGARDEAEFTDVMSPGVLDPEANVRRKKQVRRRLRRSGICKMAALTAAAVLIFTCLIGVTRAETNDMRPAIHAGDILVYLRPGHPVSTDVVLYQEEGAMRSARLQTTEGLPEELATDGIPALRTLPPDKQIKGRLILIIRRRPI